ncbi:hypothetical protein MHIMP23_23840 [Methylobacterium hispanicum]
MRAALRAIGAELGRWLPPPTTLTPAERPAAASRSIPMITARESLDLAAGEPTDVRILVAIAGMSARQDAMMRTADEAKAAAAAQHRELMERIGTFVPRAEIELKEKALHDRLDGFDKRLTTVEGRIWKAIAWILSAVGTAVAGVVGIKGAG